MKELDKKYDHRKVEEGLYKTWLEKKYFEAGDMTKKPYCVVIPPPNVTGKLHIGHAWDNTLQDIIVRYKRMEGYDTLYLPGMDHAAIATEAKVVDRLKAQGINKYELGREGFLKAAWQWKEEYAEHIREQWGYLGNSLDYTRERFTLDEGLNEAVTEVFVKLYEEGLIYRGERIINWDPVAKTALSNIEVIHKDTEGGMYYFNYKVQETGEDLAVATTRPETMFGDVCVVVHPDDPRFTHLIGKHAVNPANGEPLIIIADTYIDMEFGTGAMKCTPAHDPNDFLIGKKYGLPMPVCINPDGTMNELAGEYNGLDRFECRKRLVERIRSEGGLIRIEKIVHPVGHSERTDAIVEPYLSKQWFVNMKPLAEAIIEEQKKEDAKIHFYPERFERQYLQWLENIEDWCISRQLWWGHRIPAWYRKDTGEIYVGRKAPEDIENWEQDEDVLDTWFSSALWPFSTLGWPHDTADLERYYPTDCMVTGYDILTFWVVRMAFQGKHFTGKLPFKDVLIHGLVRDEFGRKMSKSLGNGVDPIEEINKYGADALRLFLSTNSTPGQDIRYIPKKVDASWNFLNKMWNASRFVMMNLGDFGWEDIDLSHASFVDTWVLSKLNETIEEVKKDMDRYEFGMAAGKLDDFAWDTFCDWYLELVKANLQDEDENVRKAAKSTLLIVLTDVLKMLHPFCPFITESIYQALPHTEESIVIASYPEPLENISAKDNEKVDQMIAAIKTARQIRLDYDLKPGAELTAAFTDADGKILEPDAKVANMLKRFAKIQLTDHLEGETVHRPIPAGLLAVAAESLFNREEEIAKLTKEAEKLAFEIQRSEKMLGNPGFVNKAPAAKVEEERTKLEKNKLQAKIVADRLEALKK
ncbi:MAG: valine--tRNA ligase [Erysipelotrichales bacterium]|nr:valine--tRNA ligase [Erysipelotrichales bacterium]MBQ4011625.1 valine--tRNA ligase [Erysipelotrichales bacterium]MBQ4375451.1 valine--tRNA ligase [Erysipelotrichales bacterium]MBQ5541949.1 valine--tRNA ligase [Erysipelotrichales bacterium]